MTNLVPAGEPRFPGAPSPELAATLWRLNQDLTRAGAVLLLPSNRMPEPGARAALERRAVELAPWTAPAGKSDVFAEVMGLFNGLQPRFASEEERAAQMVLYTDDLSGVPRWALAASCQAYRRAEVGDGRKMPTAGEVRIRAVRLVEALDREERQIRAVLNAQPGRPAPTPERCAALVAAARDLAAAMRIDNGPPKRGGMTDAELREARALSEAVRTGTPDPRPMPKASPALRRSLGLPPLVEHQDDHLGAEHAA